MNLSMFCRYLPCRFWTYACVLAASFLGLTPASETATGALYLGRLWCDLNGNIAHAPIALPAGTRLQFSYHAGAADINKFDAYAYYGVAEPWTDAHDTHYLKSNGAGAINPVIFGNGSEVLLNAPGKVNVYLSVAECEVENQGQSTRITLAEPLRELGLAYDDMGVPPYNDNAGVPFMYDVQLLGCPQQLRLLSPAFVVIRASATQAFTAVEWVGNRQQSLSATGTWSVHGSASSAHISTRGLVTAGTDAGIVEVRFTSAVAASATAAQSLRAQLLIIAP